MNLGAATVVLRSRRPAEVVDLTLRFLRSLAPRSFLMVGAWTILPAWSSCLLLRHLTSVGWPVVWAAAVFLAGLLELPFLCLCGRLLFDSQATPGQAFADMRHHLIRFAGVRILLLILMIVTAPSVLGPLLVAVTFCFSAEALVLERASTWGALKRSRAFLRGRSGVGMETIIVRLFTCVGFVFGSELLARHLLLEGLDIAVETDGLLTDGGSAFGLFGFFCAAPYTATFRFLAYINERTRQDGWDVQVAMLGVAEEQNE